MAPTIVDTIIEDAIADVFVDLKLIDGTGSYFLDLDDRVFRHERRPLEKTAPVRPYICLGGTRIMPPPGLAEQPNNWESWDVNFDLYLYVDIDDDDPDKAHRDLILGLSDINMAIKIDECRNELAQNTWVNGTAELDTVTSKESPLLKCAAMRVPIGIHGLRSKRGDMTQVS